MIWMDVDVALSEIPVNVVALIDDTDFKSREESVAYNQAGLDLVWNFITSAGAFTQTAVTPTTGGVHDWVNQGNAIYSIEIPASGGTINNNTEGYGWFSGFATGVLPWSGPIIGFRAAGLNDLLCDSAYSATRGLSGTSLPAVAADAAGGLPVSDAGALDLDAIATNTARLTAVRAAVLTDWINGGRLDALIDAILLSTGTTLDALIKDIPTVAEFEARSDVAGTAATPAEVATALIDINLDHIMKTAVSNRDTMPEVVDDTVLANLMTKTDGDMSDFDHATDSLEAIRDAGGGDATVANQTTILSRIGTPADIDGGGADLANNIKKIVDDNAGATFDATNDSLDKIRDRGDAAWAGAPESVSGTIAVQTADTVFNLTATSGTLSTQDDTYNNMIVCILDNSGSVFETARITDYVGASTRITIDHELTFPVQDGVDTFVIYRAAYAPVGAASITEGDKNDIVDKVHDEDLLAAHKTVGSAGYFLRRSGSRY